MKKTTFRWLLVASIILSIFSAGFDWLFPSAMPAILSKALETYYKENIYLSKRFLIFMIAGCLFLIPLVATYVGLFLFRPWSRGLAVIVTIAGILLTILMGPTAYSGWTSALGEITNALWISIIAVAYLSPLRDCFVKGSAPQASQLSPQEPEDDQELEEEQLELSQPLNNSRKPYPLIDNIKAGFRATFFLRSTPNESNATWSQLLLLTFIDIAIQFTWDFAPIGLKGELSLYGLPGAMFGLPIIILTAWVLALLANQPSKTLLLLVVFSAINLPFEIFDLLMRWARAQYPVAAFLSHWSMASYYFLLGWLAIACGVAAIRILGIPARKYAYALVLAILFIGVPTAAIDRNQTLWKIPYDENAADDWNKKYNILGTENVFYLQPKLLERELASVKSSRKTGIDMFFVGVAGYSSQDVFMKEVQYVSNVFKKRFGTEGHSVTLINNPDTVTQSPIASATSLELSLKRVGEVMDRDKDILFLYLTSHGSKDHKFSLDFGSMQFNDLDPRRLRTMLDKSGIKRRVIVVSACYSGGFIDPLKNDDSLIITSAAPDKTSFGCSNDAVFTYFGKAYFDEALQKTDSFIDAFDQAKPIIMAREKAEDFTPSDPRISVGANIKAILNDFNRQLPSARAIRTSAANRPDEPAIVKKSESKVTSGVPSPIKNEAADQHFQDAGRFLALTRQIEMLEESMKKCNETMNSRTPASIAESAFKTNQNYFKGLTPQSKLWPKVVDAYANYMADACGPFNVESYANTITEAYSTNLTAEELASAIKFYSSSHGKKLVAANMAAYTILLKNTMADSTAASQKAEAQFTQKISDLAVENNRLSALESKKKKAWWVFW